jgi:hypothetical protein
VHDAAKRRVRVRPDLKKLFLIVIASAFFRLTISIVNPKVEIEHRRFDARPGANLSPTSAIQGSASDSGVHARASGSPMNHVEPTYCNQ